MKKEFVGKEALERLISLIKANKQDKTDKGLKTKDKSIVGAINEVNDKVGQGGGSVTTGGLTEEQVKEVVRATAVTQETDPTVHDWAKQPKKPTYSYDEITDKPDYGEQLKKIDGTVDAVNSLITEVAEEVKTVKSIAKGANQAISFVDYQTMITALNALPKDKYNIGQSIYIGTLNVPDLWVSGVLENSATYTYTTDEDIAEKLKTNGVVQVGYYVLSALETQKVDLTDYAKKEELENVAQLVDDFNGDIAELYNKTDSLITYGTTDIGVDAELETGKMYVVYEE